MLDISPTRNHTAHGLAWSSWSRKRMGAWGSVLTSGKLNNWTINDAYSLPCIDETFNSLQGLQWFSLLNLKSGYWQVKVDEESKPLTTFTVGPLGFHKYSRMPFGLTNPPATFKWLMETCLGDLNLNWCIIYLEDIVIFQKIQPAILRGWKPCSRSWNRLG